MLGNLNSARCMTLTGRASSEDATRFVSELAATLRGRTTKPFRTALGAFVCDLLRNASRGAEQWSYREMGANTFAGTLASRKTIAPILVAMTDADLVQHLRGHSAYDGGSFGARATRVRGTPAFFELAAGYGIEPKRWRDHFDVPAPEKIDIPNPLELAGTAQRFGRLRGTKPLLPIPANDTTANDLRDRLVAINRYMEGHDVRPWGKIGYRRRFLMGDQPGFAWNKGGRIWAVGDSHQNSPKEDRWKATINGEPVAEIDIRASNLTLLYGLKGMPLEMEDPYSIDGLPREVVKDWITMTFGHTGFHTRWPQGVQEKLARTIEGPLRDRFPISAVRERVLEAHPVLSDWSVSSLCSEDLQYAESCIMFRTMESLAFEHDIPCLPIHDSIIIPASQVALAADVLKKAFSDEVGIAPSLGVYGG